MIIRMMGLQIRLEPYFGGLSLLMGCPHFGPHSFTSCGCDNELIYNDFAVSELVAVLLLFTPVQPHQFDPFGF